jgi:hypothetical protein
MVSGPQLDPLAGTQAKAPPGEAGLSNGEAEGGRPRLHSVDAGTTLSVQLCIAERIGEWRLRPQQWSLDLARVCQRAQSADGPWGAW